MNDELIIINDLTDQLQKDGCSIRDIKGKISELSKTRKSPEFAKLQKAIKNYENKKIDAINTLKISAYKDLLSLIETTDENHSIINKEIFKAIKKPLYYADADKLLECTVQLELIAKIDPPVSDKVIKQKLSIEMLQNKFSSKKSTNNEIKDLLIDFINNLKSNKISASEKKLWKRISDVLVKLADRLP